SGDGAGGSLPGAEGAMGRLTGANGIDPSNGVALTRAFVLSGGSDAEAEAEDTLYVNLNIIFDATAGYTKDERQSFMNTYVAQAQQDFGNIGMQFCVTQTTCTASNSGNENSHEIDSAATP